MILIPVKDFRNAKQRLAGFLSPSARTELAKAMLADVLRAVEEFGKEAISVVTSDGYARELAKQHGCEVISDEQNSGETDAIAMATQLCCSRGIESTLVLPGDIPLIAAEDLRAIYESAPREGSVLVPSSDKCGSNAILRRPAALFPLRFGNDSFAPHLQSAIATNTSCVVLSLPQMGLDVDTPADLRELARAAGHSRSQVLARKFLEETQDAIAGAETSLATAKA